MLRMVENNRVKMGVNQGSILLIKRLDTVSLPGAFLISRCDISLLIFPSKKGMIFIWLLLLLLLLLPLLLLLVLLSLFLIKGGRMGFCCFV